MNSRRHFVFRTTFFLVVLSWSALLPACQKACPIGTLRTSDACVRPSAGAFGTERVGAAGSSAADVTSLGSAMMSTPQAATAGAPAAASTDATTPSMNPPGTSAGAGMSAHAMMEAQCAQADEVRCGSASPQARERCAGGMWTPYTPCPAAQVCGGSGTSKPGECLALAEVCRGMGSTKACDGSGTMYDCGPDENVVGTPQRCESADLCIAGLVTGVCAMCLPTTFMCSGTSLLACPPDGSGYAAMDSCDSVELCDAQAGTCNAPACEVGQRTCMGRDLYECNQSRTEYERQSSCPAGCNMQRGECNMCDPAGAARCSGDTTLVACRADGSGEDSKSCPKACNGGQCVECVSSSQCTSDDPCKPSQCDSSLHRCTTGLSPRKTSCGTDRVCDDRGSCVECVDDNDCARTDPKTKCGSGSSCQRRPGLEKLQTGTFSLTLNAGYGLQASLSMNGQGDNPVTIQVGSQSASLSKSNPSFSFNSAATSQTVRLTPKEHKEAATCDRMASIDGSGSTATIYFEDIDGSGADCRDPVITLRAQ